MNMPLYQLIAVAGGGALGALGRYALSLSVVSVYPARPYLATLAANALGSFVIGMLYVVLVERAVVHPLYRPFLMVGVLGAFTTFSTFALDALVLFQNGQWSGAVAYLLISVLLSIVAVTLGYWVAQLLI